MPLSPALIQDVVKDTKALPSGASAYDLCEKMSESERLPYIQAYTALEKTLPTDQLEGLIKAYQHAQPVGNPYLTDKIAIGPGNFTLFLEMQGLDNETYDTLLRLKWLLSVKDSIDLANKIYPSSPDQAAHQVALLYFRTQSLLDGYDALNVTANRHRAGYTLTTEHAMQDKLRVEDEAKGALYQLSTKETHGYYLPPLLYFGVAIHQAYSVQDYQREIDTILEEYNLDEEYAALSVTGPFFRQPALNSAIGFDNTHAALAFIQTIAKHKGLTDIQKRSLLNYRSEKKGAVHSATPLLLAIQRGNRACVDALLKTDMIEVNLPDLKGLTPLDWAFIMVDRCIFYKLMAKRADLSQAYYFKHPWIKDTINREAHPELQQIKAHFWDRPEIFYTRRQHQPDLARLEENFPPSKPVAADETPPDRVCYAIR